MHPRPRDIFGRWSGRLPAASAHNGTTRTTCDATTSYPAPLTPDAPDLTPPASAPAPPASDPDASWQPWLRGAPDPCCPATLSAARKGQRSPAAIAIPEVNLR